MKNKKLLILFLSLTVIIILSYFAYGEIQNRKTNELAQKYSNIVNSYDKSNQINIKDQLVEIINEKNSTYSPLALYFIIDNNIQASNEEINQYFDIIINKANLDKEIKNLIIYKKGLWNSEFENENTLINILNPLFNSNSVWKSHALYLMAEYFFYKNQKQKAKEFYEKILNYEKSNQNVLLKTKKRLSKDFSE